MHDHSGRARINRDGEKKIIDELQRLLVGQLQPGYHGKGSISWVVRDGAMQTVETQQSESTRINNSESKSR